MASQLRGHDGAEHGAALLRVLLATRPPGEARARAHAVGLALALHGALAVGLLVAGPLGGEWHAPSATEGAEGESTVTLLLPGAVRAPPAKRRSVAPPPGPRAAPSLATPTPATLPGSAPPLPAAAAPAEASPARAAEPAPILRRFLPTYVAPLAPPPLPEIDAERAAGRVGRSLGDVVDSILAADAARRRFRDWEVGKGSPWGFTPEGRPRLGGIPVPGGLKAELSTAPGVRERARREQSNWSDIQRAAASADARRIIDDRIKAIRERRARERADSAAARHH